MIPPVAAFGFNVNKTSLHKLLMHTKNKFGQGWDHRNMEG